MSSIVVPKKRTKKKPRKKRLGRLERHKVSIVEKERIIADLRGAEAKLKNAVLKVAAHNKALKKKLMETELENVLLRDPRRRSNRMRKMGLSATLASSGRYQSNEREISLDPKVKIISNNEIEIKLGSGRFGDCHLGRFSHFKACKKVFKHANHNNLCREANILAQFTSERLPFLLGVCTGVHPSIVTVFHGFGEKSITIHHAVMNGEHLAGFSVDWKYILYQIMKGVHELHNTYTILHNDIKCDNIVLTAGYSSKCVNPVIIDFGKACPVAEGKHYKLSNKEKMEYKINHPQIAPDLRDGLCAQSPASDIFSFGRIMSIISKYVLKDDHLHDLSKQCMLYHSSMRPTIMKMQELLK